MYTNHRHYTLFIFAICAFAVAAAGYLYLRARVYSHAIRSAELLEEVKATEEKQEHEYDVAATYAKLVQEQELLKGYVISKDQAVTFIEKVEKIGEDTSTTLELSNISTDMPAKGKKADVFSYLRVHIEGTGSWSSLMRALILIENLPLSVTVTNFRIAEDGTIADAELSGTSTRSKPKRWRMGVDVKVLTHNPNENP